MARVGQAASETGQRARLSLRRAPDVPGSAGSELRTSTTEG